LGALTILSTVTFLTLRPNDGNRVSNHPGIREPQ